MWSLALATPTVATMDATSPGAARHMAIPGVEATDVELLELRLLLEALYQMYGLDFRDYSLASVLRRVKKRVAEEHVASISALQHRMLRDDACMYRLLQDLSIGVTSLFRDPALYVALRRHAAPILREQRFVRVWCAGCSTGEEAYSIAIVLHEEGLLDRCRIYATDMNATAIATARRGGYAADGLEVWSDAYLAAGGTSGLSRYLVASEDRLVMRRSLRANMVFAQHNLVTDGSFNEFHLIVCRNVTIYFTDALENRVHDLLFRSLAPGGVLSIGPKESLRGTPHEQEYEVLDDRTRLYRRVAR